MTIWDLPWIELAILVPVLGSMWVNRFRDPLPAFAWGLTFTGTTLVLALFAWLSYSFGTPETADAFSLQVGFLGRRWFSLDELSAPLVPLVALLHFLTALATGRTKMRRFSLTWSLASEAIRIATLSSTDPWLLIFLLSVGTIPAYFELANRRKPTRVYLIHMAAFVGLMNLGWTFIDPAADHTAQSPLATIPLLVALLIRCGAMPAHCWITDWFEHASFGNAILFVTPLTGVYAIVRLVLPYSPDWLLQSLGWVSIVTAVYASGMALVQHDARRFFAYLFLSHASLVLVGLELHTATSLTGALALWVSVALSLAGFGLTLRALEARFGRLDLRAFRGLYEHAPTLAVCFILTGLACVGFPGTLAFVATEVLVDSAVEANSYVGLLLVFTGAVNGIAIVRVYFRLFTGARHLSAVSLASTWREKFAVLTLILMILLGGMFPQPGIASRYRAAIEILHRRATVEARGEPAPAHLEGVAARFTESTPAP